MIFSPLLLAFCFFNSSVPCKCNVSIPPPLTPPLQLAVPCLVFYLFIYIRSTMPDKDSVDNYVAAWEPGMVSGVPSYHMLFRYSEDGEKSEDEPPQEYLSQGLPLYPLFFHLPPFPFANPYPPPPPFRRCKYRLL